MSDLKKWYDANRVKIQKFGIELVPDANHSFQFIDGEIGDYMFRIIDRGNDGADFEIINHVTGATVFHDLVLSDRSNFEIFDDAIDFIVRLDAS